MKIDFVPFLVNYASEFAAGTTYMAWFLPKITSAGVSVIYFQERRLFQPSRQEHPCDDLCSAPGICQIDTTPQSIKATFIGRHETFQYTKVCLFVKTMDYCSYRTSSICKVYFLRLCITFLSFLPKHTLLQLRSVFAASR